MSADRDIELRSLWVACGSLDTDELRKIRHAVEAMKRVRDEPDLALPVVARIPTYPRVVPILAADDAAPSSSSSAAETAPRHGDVGEPRTARPATETARPVSPFELRSADPAVTSSTAQDATPERRSDSGTISPRTTTPRVIQIPPRVAAGTTPPPLAQTEPAAFFDVGDLESDPYIEVEIVDVDVDWKGRGRLAHVESRHSRGRR